MLQRPRRGAARLCNVARTASEGEKHQRVNEKEFYYVDNHSSERDLKRPQVRINAEYVDQFHEAGKAKRKRDAIIKKHFHRHRRRQPTPFSDASTRHHFLILAVRVPNTHTLYMYVRTYSYMYILVSTIITKRSTAADSRVVYFQYFIFIFIFLFLPHNHTGGERAFGYHVRIELIPLISRITRVQAAAEFPLKVRVVKNKRLKLKASADCRIRYRNPLSRDYDLSGCAHTSLI